MANLLSEYTHLLTWVTFFSLIIFFVGLGITLFIVAAIPDDYFEQNKRPKLHYKPFSIAWIIKKLLKNILGIPLLLSGIAMLVLPRQGLSTLIIELFLIDYPGKYRLEKKLFSYPLILNSINWLRKKRKKNLFKLPPSN
jgi:hypothetical protein